MTVETKITAGASIEQLPNDTNTLKQMVLTLLGQIDDLNGQLYYLKRQLFGKKSEKLDRATDTRIFSPRSVLVSDCEQMVYNGKIKTYDAGRSAAEA